LAVASTHCCAAGSSTGSGGDTDVVMAQRLSESGQSLDLKVTSIAMQARLARQSRD
jgi:hypothetical protein